MKCTVTLTDNVCPGSVRVTARLPTGGVMRFNRSEGAVTWTGELPDVVARDLASDGYDVDRVMEKAKKKAKEKE